MKNCILNAIDDNECKLSKELVGEDDDDYALRNRNLVNEYNFYSVKWTTLRGLQLWDEIFRVKYINYGNKLWETWEIPICRLIYVEWWFIHLRNCFGLVVIF